MSYLLFQDLLPVMEGECDFTGHVNTLMQRQEIVLQSLPKFTLDLLVDQDKHF